MDKESPVCLLTDMQEEFINIFTLIKRLNEQIQYIEDMSYELEKINARTSPVSAKLPNCS